MADERDRDEDEFEDDEEHENGDGDGGGDEGLVESLVAQIREHRELIAPVATTAAAAAATYAAKKLPDLISQIEGASGDTIREKLGEASNAGGMKGFAAGAASRAFASGGGGGLMQRLKQGGEQEAQEEAEESGGVTGAMAKVAGKLKGGGQGGFGWGKGRRLPIVQSVDVPAPVRTVYDQWTQFEELNSFMHRVESVEQEEPETVVWHENIWGRRRHWKTQITEQVPDQRIAWELKGGGQGKGVITFHELAPRLTRVEVVFDWQPQGIVEKLGSGLRVHNRAAKTDLRRFKAFVATRGEESGAWRGRIEDGEAKGQTRNRRNRQADPVPTEAQQHGESDERKAREKGDGDGGGDGSEAPEEARAERKRHRDERAKGRTRSTSGTSRSRSGTGSRSRSRTKESA